MGTPLKRHQALVQFSREHHFGLLLGWKIRQGNARGIMPKRMADYVIAAFDAEVLPHFVNEEKELFVLLPNTDVMKKRAEEDHFIIRQKINDIKANADIKDLEAFATLLSNHIRFEERQLFPYIEEQSSFEDYAKAKTAHDAAPHDDIDSTWDDHFWQ